MPVSGISPTEYLPQRIWGVAQFPLRLREIMPVMPVSSGTIEYTQETSYTPSATVVPETTPKPAMAISFAEATAKCSTVASIVKVSKQSLADTGLMNTWLNVRLGYSVNLKEEDVIINGDATNGISGLMQLATAAPAPVAGDQGMDTLARCIGQLMGQGYAPDGVILNAADYTAMRLLKTTIGGYVFMGEGGAGPDDETIWEKTPLVWQVPMVVSPSMAAGSFLVGAFQQSTILFSREVLTIEIAFQNEDDFIRNLVCLRGELRSGLAVPVPAGVLKGTLPAGSLTANAAAKK
jgi:HK97 family phage major capsid protein